VDLREKRELNRGFGDALSEGFELVGTVVIFFFIGWGLDAWLGTKPLFMVALTILAIIGKLVVAWYRYDAQMREHEAKLPGAKPS
jgi:F0F1-type ATP synthase assembly protein I